MMVRLRKSSPKVRILETRIAPAIIPVGVEFGVNTWTTSSQYASAVAVDQDGDFVVVWESYAQDGSSFGIYGQRYDSGGLPAGPEFQINTYTTGKQSYPSVAMDPAGDFVVVWASSLQDGSDDGVYAQRYDALGNRAGNEFLVNTTTFNGQSTPVVGKDQNGNFVVAWSYYTSFFREIRAQRFRSDGLPLGGELTIATSTVAFNINQPAIAMDYAGNFVVTWTGMLEGLGVEGVYARRFGATGVPLGSTMHVNTYTSSSQWSSAAAMDQDGDFVIAWRSLNQDGSANGIYAQRFGSSGQRLGGEFRVNTYTTNDQANPTVAMDADGDFLVAWTSKPVVLNTTGQDGSEIGVYAQAFRQDGTFDGGEFRANTYTNGDQNGPAVANDASGNCIIAWTSRPYGGLPQDGSEAGVFAQRYRVGTPRLDELQINGGAAQRSRVTSLRLTFNTQIAFVGAPSTAFALTRINDNEPVNFSATAELVDGVTRVTLDNFTGPAAEFNSLTDGRFTLRAQANQTSAGGQPLDGNGDGIPGDDYVLIGSPANGLFRLFGDSDGNGTVNTVDFNAFRSAFGGLSTIFDFDNAGGVGTLDFNQFRQRFGASV